MDMVNKLVSTAQNYMHTTIVMRRSCRRPVLDTNSSTSRAENKL